METLGIMFALVLASLLALVAWQLSQRHARRREATRLLATVQTLAAHLPTAFIAWHPRDGVTLWNAGAERLFGLGPEHTLGKPLPAGLAALQQATAWVHVGAGLKPRRLLLRHADGSAVNATVSLCASPVSDAEALFVASLETAVRAVPDALGADEARAQRDALVREVHHRIKNSLQGVAGLLRQHLSDKPALKPLLEAASSQVSTIAAVHGLHGETPCGQINLRMLVARVAASVSGILRVPIVLSERCTVLEGFTVNEEESVPVAMVLNELIMNAVKHRQCATTTGVVVLDAQDGPQQAQIRISNPGILPVDFDLDAGTNIGNGLGLIRALLPRRGARIALVQDGACVVASLTLRAPDVLRTRVTGLEAVA